jgi:thioredoxin reductase (NADPH)
VIVATGVSYRRLGIPAVDRLVGMGVFYGAAAAEAQAMSGRHVYVVGGANSAGQAAVHLSRYADEVTLVVRRSTLTETMSAYLVREIEASPRILVRYGCEVVDGQGEDRLTGLTLWDRTQARPAPCRRRRCSSSSVQSRTPLGCPTPSCVTPTGSS